MLGAWARVTGLGSAGLSACTWPPHIYHLGFLIVGWRRLHNDDYRRQSRGATSAVTGLVETGTSPRLAGSSHRESVAL